MSINDDKLANSIQRLTITKARNEKPNCLVRLQESQDEAEAKKAIIERQLSEAATTSSIQKEPTQET